MTQPLCSHLISPDGYLVSSLQNRVVFKDQCTQCFSCPLTSPLIICLGCLDGGCSIHSQSHYLSTKHAIGLGMSLVKRVTIDTGDNKLIHDEKIDYDMSLTIQCRICQVTQPVDNRLPSSLLQIIDSVVKHKSYFQSLEIAGFELDIQPCKHSLTLTQQPFPGQHSTSCNDCDLSSNLWLCLDCGRLGCGREYFDGSGGKNHAVNHAQTAGHCLAVKLGTITADGSASVFCYICNDDVSDPLLAHHLHHLGIPIANQKQTEKSVAEMNMDLNKNNQMLSQIFEKDSQYNYVYPDQGRYVGLANIGNSCYINSVLQVLFNIAPLQQKYLTTGHSCNQSGPCVICQTKKYVNAIYSSNCQFSKRIQVYDKQTSVLIDEYQEGLKLNNLKNAIGEGNPEFLSNKQQDAQEYLLHLIAVLSNQEKKHKMGDSAALLESVQYEQTACHSCGRYKLSIIQQAQMYMTYIRNDDISFANLIMQNQEQLQEKLKCFKCKTLHVFTKTRGFCEFSPFLFVNVNRLLYENWVPSKATGQLLFPFNQDGSVTIDFSCLLKEQQVLKENQFSGEDVDQDELGMLMSMGYEYMASIQALIEYEGQLDKAVESLTQGSQQGGIDSALIGQIMEMGFSSQMASYALSKHKGQLEIALDYLFSNDPSQIELEISQQENTGSQQMANIFNELKVPSKGTYSLEGAIIHLGTSIQCGHYVCYVRRDGQWLYINDNKVAVVERPQLEKATLLLFRQI